MYSSWESCEDSLSNLLLETTYTRTYVVIALGFMWASEPLLRKTLNECADVFVHQRHITNANVIDILTVQFPAVTWREAPHSRPLSRDCLIAYPQRSSSLLEPCDLLFFHLNPAKHPPKSTFECHLNHKTNASRQASFCHIHREEFKVGKSSGGKQQKLTLR